MVFHYIESHDYCLPDPVVLALAEWNDNAWRNHIVSPDVDRDVRLLGGRIAHADGDTLHVQLVHGEPEHFLHLAQVFRSLKGIHIKVD
jgi:hypothetical protein